MKIAIDGPAGAGKSTVAKIVAQKLGFIYIDTGAMYRALTWQALQNGINVGDSNALLELAKSTDIHFESFQQIFCNRINVTNFIRSPEVTAVVSTVASHPEVRRIMVQKQQKIARANVVMDGRDIGECVLPNADYKFFITANIDERTRRRMRELHKRGINCEFENVKADIAVRDQNDMKREVGALKILPDSIIIDSSDISIDEVVAQIFAIIREA